MRDHLLRGLGAYVSFYQSLSLDTLHELPEVVSPHVHFRDPFNDVRGTEKVRQLLEELLRLAPTSKFTVLDAAWSGETAYLKWQLILNGSSRRWVNGRTLVGMSEIAFDDQGRVKEHIDYWDAAAGVYEHIPVLGAVLRRIRRSIGTEG